ncbi:putative two-component system response regulator [Alloactinosynnema sp. L-07]|uniref:LuxR C-terminal-related transcriptional regulator n=1 Tax=Alloactinosynnema sp. L-07 TaxID=1653480 RepID=UPI00065EF3E3|nr:response regulator transcription factor [Alloactinosynnema sp. L-07]CRK56534.1 putative two-component system response regulator [Alloactinosynnema sp. L-07]
MDTVIRLGIIDDEELLLDAMRITLAPIADMRLVATASTVRDYLDKADAADIVLLDLNLRDYSKPAANVAALVATGIKVVVFSVHADHEHVLATTEAGACAYVLKSGTNTSELMGVIREVAAGGSPMTVEHAFSLSRDTRSKRPHLSPREREVLHMYATGRTLHTTARRLDISESTARTHLQRIKEKYQAVGRPINHRTDYTLRHQEDNFGRETLDDPPDDQAHR